MVGAGGDVVLSACCCREEVVRHDDLGDFVDGVMWELLTHLRTVISTGAGWFYRPAKWRDLQIARAGNSAGTSKLQVSPLRRQRTSPSVEMTM